MNIAEQSSVLMPSAAAAAKEWIDALPGGEFFFASGVPGRPAAVRPLLSRLAADEDHPVQRQRHGFYVKQWDSADESRAPLASEPHGALKLAGGGGGGALAFALHRIGWTLQIPCRYDFAVVGRTPASPWPYVRFRRRSNSERVLLTWAEVTLIEAVRAYGLLECIPWDSALDALADGSCIERMALGAIRSDEVLRVSEFEQCQPSEFHRRMTEAADAMRGLIGPSAAA